MAREKGTGNLQMERSGRWTMRYCVDGKRCSRSTGTADRAKAELCLARRLASLGRGRSSLPLAGVWEEYVKSPRRRDLADSSLNVKRRIWQSFARWMAHNHLEVGELSEVSSENVAE